LNPFKSASCDCLTIAGNLLSAFLYTGAATLGTTGTGATIEAGVTALAVGKTAWAPG